MQDSVDALNRNFQITPKSDNAKFLVDFFNDEPNHIRIYGFDETKNCGFLILFDSSANNMRASFAVNGEWKDGKVLANFT